MNPIQRKGRRGGRQDRPANRSIFLREKDDRPTALAKGLPNRPVNPADSTKVAEVASVYVDTPESMETIESHLVPRRALTLKQHLKLFPQDVEVEALSPIKHVTPSDLGVQTTVTIQTVETNPDRVWGESTLRPVTHTLTGKVVTVEDERVKVAWKSDKNLLRVPRSVDGNFFKRVTSHTKRIKGEIEEPATIEVPTTSPNEID